MARRKTSFGSAPRTHKARLNKALARMERAASTLHEYAAVGDCNTVLDEVIEVASEWGKIVANNRGGAGDSAAEHTADRILDAAVHAARKCLR